MDFLQFNVLIAEEISSLPTFLKEKTLFLFIMCFICHVGSACKEKESLVREKAEY